MNANGETIKERQFTWLLCLAAAIHVFAFSAAFPFFNNVDEAFHFDLVLKYSHGAVPSRIEFISPDSATFLALMNCHAYFGSPDQYPGGVFPAPAWTLPEDKSTEDIAARRANWETQENYEVSQAPLYYMLAGLWWHIGGWIGFHDGRLVYWLRFLNIGLISALVWLGYATARLVFPDNSFASLTVPALVAFMPETAFYSIGNDLLSALCFGMTFLFLLRWLASEIPTPKTGALMGLGFAATYLAKINNVPLLAIAVASVLIKAAQDARRGKFRATLPGLAAFAGSGLPPILAWMVWCKFAFGSLTGSSLKTQFLGWTLKPFGQWWEHPIFTHAGLWIFVSGEFQTFWQGEFTWQHQWLVLPGTGLVYTTFSLAMLAWALPVLWARRSDESNLLRWALGLGLVCFIAEMGLFAMLSIVYDYHDCPAPSRSFPYFIAGRLLLGALIPFLLALVYGMDRILKGLKARTKIFTLFLCIGVMLSVEVASDWPALFNEYNWFHLP
jgi:branched-subunit amino acid transport protein